MKARKKDLSINVTNLILNSVVKEERRLLITYNNHIEDYEDIENSMMNLFNERRLLAVKNISSKEVMSRHVNDFYKK
ncbi:hypothetical protein BOVMAS02_08440 [Streptococcus uberis]|uniref:Uncharacterized protein n=1 Tax=Streptococcus uberis (strain ATCC BAA-854 / 0140J) TaxID=218495 RepID=B9DTY6_STRU0